MSLCLKQISVTFSQNGIRKVNLIQMENEIIGRFLDICNGKQEKHTDKSSCGVVVKDLVTGEVECSITCETASVLLQIPEISSPHRVSFSHLYGKKVKICWSRVFWPTPTPRTSPSAWRTAQRYLTAWTWPLTPGKVSWFATFSLDSPPTIFAALELEELRKCQRYSK